MSRRARTAVALLTAALLVAAGGAFAAWALTRPVAAPASVPPGWIGSAPPCSDGTYTEFPCWEHDSRLTMADDVTRDCRIFSLGIGVVRYECDGGYVEEARTG